MAPSALSKTPPNGSTSSQAALPSNTIILTGFDRSDFPAKSLPNEEETPFPSSSDDTSLSSEIRHLLQDTNEIPIVHWGNLKSFGRVIVVFQTVQDAAQAKQIIQASEQLLGGPDKTIKAQFDKHTPLYEYENEDNHLRLPDQGRLFFISPPPSPPAGWVSIPEASPNTETFHSDLHEALSSLTGSGTATEGDGSSGSSIQAETSDMSPFPSEMIVEPVTGKLKRRVTLHQSSSSSTPPALKLQTALQPAESPSVHTPTIVVEWDDDDEPDSSHLNPGAPTLASEDRPEKLRPTRTERPPM